MWIDCGETKNIQTKRDKQKNGETELKSYSMHCPQYFILTFHLDHYEILCLQNMFVIMKLLCYYLLLAYCYVRFYDFLKSKIHHHIIKSVYSIYDTNLTKRKVLLLLHREFQSDIH